MRIAQIAPLFESVPPMGYGGTERVVSYLTEELVALGHDVTLFASGDSVTRARLEAPRPSALRLDPECSDYILHHVLLLERFLRHAADFDIVHFHIDYLHFPITRLLNLPNVTTLHGRLDLPDLAALFREYHEMPVVSISDAQRKPLPWLNWQRTVYHGLPPSEFRFYDKPRSYLAFLGRISPEKGVDRAIAIARRAGMQLKIAAKIDRQDREYFEESIRPLLRGPDVEYLGEVGGPAKNEFLGNAYALLFPISWPEPFGLVMIEAMACGTPVIACRNGSVPEVMVDGETGFVCTGVDDAVEAVQSVPHLSRRRCREVFEQRFSVSRMAAEYLEVYERLAAGDHIERRRGWVLENGNAHLDEQFSDSGQLVQLP